MNDSNNNNTNTSITSITSNNDNSIEFETTVVTDTNLAMIQSDCMNCLQQLPTATTMYTAIIIERHVRTTNNHNNNKRVTVSELLLILWDMILTTRSTMFDKSPPPQQQQQQQHHHSTDAAATTSTTSSSSSSSSFADIVSFVQSFVPNINNNNNNHDGDISNIDPTKNTITNTSTTTTKETIVAYQNRIVAAYIFHHILIPVIQRIWTKTTTRTTTTTTTNGPQQQQQLWWSHFINAMATSIHFQLLVVLSSSSSSSSSVNAVVAPPNMTGFVQLIRQVIQYINDHLPPSSLAAAASTDQPGGTSIQVSINPLSESLLKYCTNISFLQDVGIITAGNNSTRGNSSGRGATSTTNMVVEQLLSKRLRMINTAIHYRQYKFNLLVEESEGYAKLLYYLVILSNRKQDSTSTSTSTSSSAIIPTTTTTGITTTTATTTTTGPSVTATPSISLVDDDDDNDEYHQLYQSIHSMIGTFHLDPNRCLDIIIDLFEYDCFSSSIVNTTDCPNSTTIHQRHPSWWSDDNDDTMDTTTSTTTNVPDQQRLRMYVYCISILHSTTKLPQLFGYKLRCRMKNRTTLSNLSIASFQAQRNNDTTPKEALRRTTSVSTHNDGITSTGSVIPYNVSSLLDCMAWLCVQQPYHPRKTTAVTTTPAMTTTTTLLTSPTLLDPTIMLSYIPDDADDGNETTNSDTTTNVANRNNNYEEMLESVYHHHVLDEKVRIRTVGRVSLADTTTNNEKATESLPSTTKQGKVNNSNDNRYSIRTIEDHCITQWITIFLQNQQFTVAIQNLLSHTHWTMLSVLLPRTIGIGILDCIHATYISKWLSSSNVTSWLSTSQSSKVDANKKNDDSTLSVGDVLSKIVDPLMFTMESGCIARRPILFCQLCRLLTNLLTNHQQIESESVDNSADVVMSDINNDITTTQPATRKNLPLTELIHFLQSYLVPCLSLFQSNPAMSMEVWNVIKTLPYATRYSLYGAWRGTGVEQRSLLAASSLPSELVAKPLWLIEGELQTGKDIRYSLKRISKDTIRDMSRAVAKCCHSHPLVVFTTILNQIESYDNLVQVMVDACRFVTPLSLDVLGYCILQRLNDSNDATSESRSRLKANGVNVSQWLQSLEAFTGAFYKRFPHVEFQGLLFYLLQRLKDGHVMELGVLRTLLKNGAGWSFADYSPAESLSMAQLEGRAGSTRLKRETMAFGVVSDINLSSSNEVRRVLHNNNIGVSLLILLAQVRHSIIFQKSQRSIPVKLIGNLVDASQIVMSILLDFLTNEVDHDGAEIGPKSTAIHEYASSLPTLVELQSQYKVEVASSWTLCRPLMRAARALQKNDATLAKHLSSSIARSSLTSMVSKSVWKHITTDLFEFFYATSLHDVFCPRAVYENEIVRLERETERLSHKKNAPPPAYIQPGAIPEKSDREEYERVKQMVIGLKEDYTEQKKHVTSIHETMLQKILDFFVSETITVQSAMTFFTRCIYPRCMQGPDDAMYCTHFVSLLHQNATPGFSTLHYFDALIQIVPRSLYCLTEGEAACASILLLDTWKTVSRWRYDESSFESELVGKPGSFIVKDIHGDPIMVTKQDYEYLYNKWHAAIGDTLVGCLRSKEYIHLRCGLIVLTRIVDEYPTRPKLANELLEALEPLKEESNTFADIRASSQAYSMQLQRSRDNGVWKEEDAATVQARLAVSEAAAMERQKKAQEQMEQIERDSVKITATIGVSETRTRGSRGPTLLRTNSDDRLNRSSNTGVSDANRRRAATSSGPADNNFHGATNAISGGGATTSFSSYASIAPSGGEPSTTGTSTNAAGRSLQGRWVNATSGTTPPRKSGTVSAAASHTTAAATTVSTTTSKSGTSESTTATTNTRKRGRMSSSPTLEQPDSSSSAKRTKVSQSDNDGKRRGRRR